MKRKVLLASLSVGKCFTLDVPPGGSEDAPGKVKATTPILKAQDAWRVVEAGDAELAAESAAGERRAFPAATKVVEIPRQGWDRLRNP